MPYPKDIQRAVAPIVALCIVGLGQDIEVIATYAEYTEYGVIMAGTKEALKKLTDHAIFPVLRTLNDWLHVCKDEDAFRELLLELDARERSLSKPVEAQPPVSSLNANQIKQLRVPSSLQLLWFICQGERPNTEEIRKVMGERANGVTQKEIQRAARACIGKIKAQIANSIPTEDELLSAKEELITVIGAVHKSLPALELLPSPTPDIRPQMKDLTVLKAISRLLDLQDTRQPVGKRGGWCSIV